MKAQYASGLAYRQADPQPEPEPEAPPAHTTIELSQPALYRRFKPLFRPRPIIYWSDMLASAIAGWAGFAFFLAAEHPTSVAGLTGLLVAVVGVYRATLFIHEIAHLKHG